MAADEARSVPATSSRPSLPRCLRPPASAQGGRLRCRRPGRCRSRRPPLARRDARRHVYRASASRLGIACRGRHCRAGAPGGSCSNAGNALGHLTGAQAMSIAIDKARQFAAASCRCGTASFRYCGKYAQQRRRPAASPSRCANTRPLMPAPGGAERVVATSDCDRAADLGRNSIMARHGDKRSRDGQDPHGRQGQGADPADLAVTAQGAPTTNAAERSPACCCVRRRQGFGLSS